MRLEPGGITASTSSGNTSKSGTNLHLRMDLFDDDLLAMPLLLNSDGVVVVILSGDFDSCSWGCDADLSAVVSSISLFEESLPV